MAAPPPERFPRTWTENVGDWARQIADKNAAPNKRIVHRAPDVDRFIVDALEIV
jgi:hypothetical protein